DVPRLVQEQPDGRAEERARRQLGAQTLACGQPPAQQRIQSAGARADRPVDGRSELLPRVVRELLAGEPGGLFRRRLIGALAAARLVLALARRFALILIEIGGGLAHDPGRRGSGEGAEADIPEDVALR